MTINPEPCEIRLDDMDLTKYVEQITKRSWLQRVWDRLPWSRHSRDLRGVKGFFE